MILAVSAKPFTRFKHAEKKFFVLSFKDQFYAVEDKCFHRGGPLSLGTFDSDRGTITCPMHELKNCSVNLIKRALPSLRVGSELKVIV